MLDVSKRLILVFQHPKKKIKGEPMMIGVPLPYLLQNGPPMTKKKKPWIYHSAQLQQ